MHLLTLCKLTPNKVYDHLYPMQENPHLEQMTLVRYTTVPQLEPLNGIQQIPYGIQGIWGRLFNPLRRVWTAFQTTRRTQPDALYAIYFTSSGVLAWIVAKLLKKPLIVSFIGTDLNKEILEYPIRHVLLPLVRRVDAMTVFDEVARQHLIALGIPAERVFVMPHAIDVDKFTRHADTPHRFDAVFVGMLIPLKEVLRLIEAWRVVVDTHPDARLALVGDGKLRDATQAKIGALGLDSNVVITGWVDDVVSYLSGSRIFINLANQEGVPHAMIEAMACGLVPVVTDVGGVASVIRDGENGFLLPNYPDPALVAERICTLLDDPARCQQMQINGEQVRTAHTYAAISAAWTPVFAYLIRRGF